MLDFQRALQATDTCYPGGPTPDANSCCQESVCLIPCPADQDEPAKGYGITVLCFAALSFAIGIASYFAVKGKAENFFVAGRSLPLWVVTITLASQSLDSNATLGNVDLSYKFHFWDGCVLPIGLGASLILNGIFLAKHVNNDNVFTLPDIFAKRYGKLVEVLVSIICIISFLALLAGNLVGMAAILGYLLNVAFKGAVFLSAAVVWAYTVTGGLFSVAYTDVFQASIGWLGLFITAMYLIATENPNAPPPSVGFPGYIYPDGVGEGGICDMYGGQPCENNSTLCCYSEEGAGGAADNGAYPIGDLRVFPTQMTDPHSLSPFPNAIFWNWATIFILGFGNLAALDFQARCMASKTPNTARYGCLIAGVLTFFVGVPFAYLGAMVRVRYGPDSQYAVFDANSCSEILGLPSCGAWVPDPEAFLKFLTHDIPKVLGGWTLVGIVAASMSTADGAILAMGTVFSHNIMRHIAFVSDKNLLRAAKGATLPLTVISAIIAAFLSGGATGYLLIVAFDVVFASVVVPLFGCFYTKKPSPLAALCAVLTGSILRIILEFTLPKDGFLILPFSGPEFLNYGTIASTTAAPTFVDETADATWNPELEPCVQERFKDYTGVDSLASAIGSLIVFVLIQFLERNGPLFDYTSIRLLAPYDKHVDEEEEVTKVVSPLDPTERSGYKADEAVPMEEDSGTTDEDKLVEEEKPATKEEADPDEVSA